MVRPSGKRNYRYHLQFPDLNLWIANVDEPNGFPNVYASPTAKALWTRGPASVVESIAYLIRELGGNVMECLGNVLGVPGDPLGIMIIMRLWVDGRWRGGELNIEKDEEKGENFSPIVFLL